MAQYDSSDSGASLGDMLGAALNKGHQGGKKAVDENKDEDTGEKED